VTEAVAPSLSLFAEAIAGHPVAFTVVDDPQACWPWAQRSPDISDVVVPAKLGDRVQCRTIVLHQVLSEQAPDVDVAASRPVQFNQIFCMVEDTRIVAATRHHYPGAVAGLDALLSAVAVDDLKRPSGEALLDVVRSYSLGASAAVIRSQRPRVDFDVVELIGRLMEPLKLVAATSRDSANVATQLCQLFADLGLGRSIGDIAGDLEIDEDAPALSSEGTTGVSLDGGTPSEYEDSDGLGGGELLSDGHDQSVVAADPDAERQPAGFDLQLASRNVGSPGEARTFMYDEWDYHEQRHRSAWCRVIEERLVGDEMGFVADVRSRHVALRTRIRRSLMRLPAHELMRVYRSDDGEELDLDAAIEAMADRRSGAPVDDRLHIRRDRAARDVATAFLVDLSASTSSPAVPPEPEPLPEIDPMDDPMSYGPLWGAPPKTEPVRRVIDVAKDAVVLMGDALNELGDRYAIYGFSGTGRDNVDFKIGKDFRDRTDGASWASVAAMKPLRYTRMGPAVRHATAKLRQEAARTRFLIVISDGYPQDTDYGRDRHDRDYGMHDTARALADATNSGIQTFCLTIDPAGHDYLRQMCPDNQYLIIDDVESLPEELAKLYLRKMG